MRRRCRAAGPLQAHEKGGADWHHGTILRDAEPEPPTPKPNAQSKAWAKDMSHKNREMRKKIGNLSLAPVVPSRTKF